MNRTQNTYIFDQAVNAGKMIFLFGPRQVGKTTLAQGQLKEKGEEFLYFNWDDPYVKREYIKNPHFLKAHLAKAKRKKPLVVFDEIHKHKNWKNILKGLYDIHQNEAQFFITGSARLDYFRKSGDSLIGRYFSYRLLPLGVAEAANEFSYILTKVDSLSNPKQFSLLRQIQKVNKQKSHSALKDLLEFSGFPEPFLRRKKNFSVKWRREYQSLLVREDLRDLSRIQDIKGVEQLMLLLPERVGSPLSVNSIRADLQVNHRTVVNWIEALKKIYLIFSLMPYSKQITKAIKRETKVYFMDWTMVEDEGARFENIVAVSLMRFVSRLNEFGEGEFDLRYIRNQQGHEVDFLLINKQKPVALFEAKIGETKLSKSGLYFSRILKVPYYQVVYKTDIIEAYPEDKYIIQAAPFLSLLG